MSFRPRCRTARLFPLLGLLTLTGCSERGVVREEDDLEDCATLRVRWEKAVAARAQGQHLSQGEQEALESHVRSLSARLRQCGQQVAPGPFYNGAGLPPPPECADSDCPAACSAYAVASANLEARRRAGKDTSAAKREAEAAHDDLAACLGHRLGY